MDQINVHVGSYLLNKYTNSSTLVDILHRNSCSNGNASCEGGSTISRTVFMDRLALATLDGYPRAYINY